ncbi:hypothetical protein FB561_1830 [Kribbella amoyensis]|uniref:Uncharacterized protein n=1 Tax=Kribbella amoyensis TaxID=996641 RepID=A0A561BPJ4_9ACTN|nr:DUF6042 family protein [Kribbella amoyensis]TWD80742.1 hypothetical protein FB561_1830 [Kribbella amoyensis]
MTLVGEYEDDDYSPEDGILVVRDERAVYGDDEMSASDAHPVGTIVRTGHGWLYAAGGDGPCVVRLRGHTDRPRDGDDEWTDVVEVPYRSTSGAVELTSLTTRAGEVHVHLGEPGAYRIRVAHRPLPASAEFVADDEDEYLEPTDLWQLDFWPVPEPVEPPRWYRRRRSAVRPADPGWNSLLGFERHEVAGVVRWSHEGTGLTIDDLRTWGIDHFRGEDWLDQPFRTTVPRDGYPTLAEIAAQVGRPEPTSRREMLTLFVALGVLTFDGTRYAGIAEPRPAQQVLDLPADVVTYLDAHRATVQYTGFAADLVSVALWGGTEQTVASLATRTLASEDQVRRALQYAESRNLLQIDRRSGDRLALTATRRGRPFAV